MAKCKVNEVFKDLYSPEVIKKNMNLFGEIIEAGSEYAKVRQEYSIGTSTDKTKELFTEEMTVDDKLKIIQNLIKNRKNEHSQHKEYEKSKIANKFIGKGTDTSSTGFYEKIYAEAELANIGEYTKDDVVFISVNGKRKDAVLSVNKDGTLTEEYKDIDKAIEAGATIILDTKEQGKDNWFNKEGEGKLYDYMSKQEGYVYTVKTKPEWKYTNKKGKIIHYGYGEWSKKEESPFETFTRTSDEATYHKEELDIQKENKEIQEKVKESKVIKKGSKVKYKKGTYTVRYIKDGKAYLVNKNGTKLKYPILIKNISKIIKKETIKKEPIKKESTIKKEIKTIEKNIEIDKNIVVGSTVSFTNGKVEYEVVKIDAEKVDVKALSGTKKGEVFKDQKLIRLVLKKDDKESKEIIITEPEKTWTGVKKSFEVKARILTKNETIKTVIDDIIETTKNGKIGDYVLTGPKGEEYTVEASKVKDRYIEVSNKNNKIILETKPVKIKYTLSNKNFTFEASWGEKMIAEIDDALVYEDGKLSYRIEKEIFNKTYETVYSKDARKSSIFQDNNSYYRGELFESYKVQKDGSLLIKGKKDPLYKKAYNIDSGVSMTDNLEKAEEYAIGQIETEKNLISDSYESETLLEEIDEQSRSIIQIKKDVITNKIIKEEGEVKIVGDILIPYGSYLIEKVDSYDDVEEVIGIIKKDDTITAEDVTLSKTSKDLLKEIEDLKECKE